MKTNEIRKSFLDFFASKNHHIVSSSSLVPENDPTLLFTNAGMNQFKDVFLGKEKRDYTRATSSQKCVRAGGKHNDLENVGFTSRHHTFFEMLGNFSFGDYFKEEAIAYAWEFATKVLKLPKEKIYITVYKDDDEAYDIWKNKQKVDPKHIFRLGEKDNFWQMGDTGPCGPCTELFIDRGPEYGEGENGKPIAEDQENDRYIEFWNLVFMQYDRAADGTLTPLPKPSVDTGAGLERIASILQNVDSNYDTDVFLDIIAQIEKLCGRKYDLANSDHYFFRVIADHARSVSFLISDGVIPANEGRGYVLRRIIRRAVRYGRELGLKDPFLNEVCVYVLEHMGEVYPELKDKKSFVQKCVRSEEEQFMRTLEKGLQLLDEELSKVNSSTLAGEVAFKLYDTYGFPYDLTVLIAKERQVNVDEAGFEKSMAKQKSQSRKGRKGDSKTGVEEVYHELHAELKNSDKLTAFTGYASEIGDSEIVGLIKDNKGQLEIATSLSVEKGARVGFILAETPFYAEGGGQVGDHGVLKNNTFEAKITDVQKPLDGLFVLWGEVTKGKIQVGERIAQEVDSERRNLIKRNHTATHLLHGALRDILGDHVKQAGSLVNDELLRFDFTHFNALSIEEITRIEQKVMKEVWKAHNVESKVTSKDQAVAEGAIAFFGEKYGDEVRMIKAGSYSVELCGGTHVNNTSDIQLFKIVSEGAIAAGVRRIVAYTSKKAYSFLYERFEESRDVREVLKAGNGDEARLKLGKVLDSEKELRRKLESAKAEQMNADLDKYIANAETFSGGKLVSFICPTDSTGIKFLRTMSDQIRSKVPDSVVILGMENPDSDKAFVLAAVGKEANSPVSADQIIKEVAPLISGRGGGKPDLAQAGGDNRAALGEALNVAQKMILQPS